MDRNKVNNSRVVEKEAMCHFKPMEQASADTGNGCSVEFMECSICGHTKDIGNTVGQV